MQRVVIALAVLCCSACTDPGVADVTLAQLAAQQDDYAGRRVVTTGTLRSHPDPLHYWIEDDAYHRVELDHAGNIAGREGDQLTVLGVFRYDKDAGRRIEVTTIE